MRRSDVAAVCLTCQTPFVRRFWSANRPPPRYCSVTCAGRAKSVATPKNPYPMIRVAGKVVSVHRHLFLTLHGPGPHPCYHCGTPVIAMTGARTRRGALIVDHLDGDTTNCSPPNLVPSCHTCNCRRNVPAKYLGEYTCEVCHTEFTRVDSHRPDRPIRFCSRRCRYLGTGH